MQDLREASSDIERAPAELLALKGAKIVVNFRSNEKSTFEVVNHIQKIGGEAIAI